MKKYMVLCVAGQSNAVGYDESEIPEDYMKRFGSDRISQLGLHDGDNLQMIPLGPCAQNFQDMRPFGHPNNPGIGTRGIHLPLAKTLLQYIPEDYDILVIPCAYGGTGFTIGEWNKSIWYNMETVSFWHSYHECPQIWEAYEVWSPETYVKIPRSADSNEVNGTGITAKQRSAHFGNGSFEIIVAPAVAQVMAKRL